MLERIFQLFSEKIFKRIKSVLNKYYESGNQYLN